MAQTNKQGGNAEQTVTENPDMEPTQAAAEDIGESTDSGIEDLQNQLEQAKAEMDSLNDQFLRARAEADNVRRRSEAELANTRRFAVESFARELLQVKDSLDLARAVDLEDGGSEVVTRMSEGLDLTLRQLDQVFEKFSITIVDPAPGDKLDPDQHQAMSVVESAEVAVNHIVTVVQKGYMLNDRLLRPAMVMVAKAPMSTQSG